ncbi:ankyrin repeat, bromo and BTB domain-containing protein DDB_G0293800-like [Temnothorax curvispinosus]|uniref:Ankyrin repeat, bromo and BTB domain-containing protein DDB_G0293800-like n=1 Tax=Temnothorax curvispinosus TaxID=300111 RepID=A0A6J1PVX8_9HYME|nr:ankyrin repeat, bromo and BTB domain-containing protein DDB_G0293800-like [Temnothorax curvispinosus]
MPSKHQATYEVFFQSYMKNNLGCLDVTGSINDTLTENCSRHIASNTLDSTTEEGNKQQWTVKGTKLLLELYKERKEKFRDPKTKKRNLWTEIVNEMGKNGYKHLTEDILDRKLRNLKKTFRTIKDNNRKSSTGQGRITWEYYDIFEEIFSDDRTINFGPTISSLDSATTAIQSSFDASTILSPTSTSTASSLMRLVASSASTRPPTLRPPVRTPSPASTRYVCHTQLTRISTPPAHTRIFMHTSDFFDSTFEGDSFFEENITNSYSSSHSSSSCSSFSSVAAERSFSESESVLGSVPNSSECTTPSTQRQQRKMASRKETYDLRKKLLLVEQERVEIMTELKKSIDDNNKIQQERNDLLKKVLEKM